MSIEMHTNDALDTQTYHSVSTSIPFLFDDVESSEVLEIKIEVGDSNSILNVENNVDNLFIGMSVTAQNEGRRDRGYH